MIAALLLAADRPPLTQAQALDVCAHAAADLVDGEKVDMLATETAGSEWIVFGDVTGKDGRQHRFRCVTSRYDRPSVVLVRRN